MTRPAALSIVHSRAYRIGPVPFAVPEALRPAWRPLFGDAACLETLGPRLFHRDDGGEWLAENRYGPDRIGQIAMRARLGETSEERAEWSSVPAPAGPFFPALGSIRLDPGPRVFDSSAPPLGVLCGLRDAESYEDAASDLPDDQRMRGVAFTLARPLQLRPVGVPGRGRIYLHVHPSGVLVVLASLSFCSLDPAQFATALAAANPRSGKLVWRSRLGEAPLSEQIARFTTQLERGLFADGGRFAGAGEWHEAVRFVVDPPAESAEHYVRAMGHRTDFELLEMSGAGVRYLIAAGRRIATVSTRIPPEPAPAPQPEPGLVARAMAVFRSGPKPDPFAPEPSAYSRRWGTRLFWRAVTVHELIQVKTAVYEAYGAFFKDRREGLLERRLGQGGDDGLTRYEPTILAYLNALDGQTRQLPALYRFVYSMFCQARRFDPLRSSTHEALQTWLDELEKAAPDQRAAWQPLAHLSPWPTPDDVEGGRFSGALYGLWTLLLDVFKPPDFEIFISDLGHGDLRHALPAKVVAANDYFLAAVQELGRRDLINSTFFDALTASRAGRESDIGRLRHQFEG